MAQIISYGNQPGFLKKISLSVERWPGTLSSQVSGDVFILDS